MPVRAVAALVAAALVCGAVPAAVGQQDQSAQALFRDVLLKDPKTADGVQRLLRTNAGFVSAKPLFADLTGDGKEDAVATVQNGGAAGAVAAYVLSAEGSSGGALRVIYRSQSLYQGQVRVSGATLTVVTPLYARGDDVCCARQATERDYVWDPGTKAFRRTAMRTVAVERRPATGP
ncbi:MAG TPA: hypothetical protein VH834_25600 [Solirubrobacteraceae bacterium]|jgi:hypothetical protein